MAQCACPSCQARLQMPETMTGKQVRCPKCKAPFVVSGVSAPKPAATKTAPAKAEEKASRSGSKSEAVMARPRPSTPVPPNKKSAVKAAPKRRSRDDEDDDDFDDVEVARPKSKKRQKEEESQFPWLLVGGIGGGVVFLIVAVIGGFFIFGGSPKKAQAIAAVNPDPVKPIRDKGGAKPEEDPADNAGPEAEAEATKGPMPQIISNESTQRVKRATAHLRVTFPGGDAADGSGFFAIERGLVVTNAHVVGMLHTNEKPKKIDVAINSGEPSETHHDATVLGVDQVNDLAILRLKDDPDGLPPPLIVDTQSPLNELQKVYIFGFPFGTQLGKNITVSESSISSFRKTNDGTLNQIQVNGGMHPGNSGGPVVDARGNVVGVSVAGMRGTQINFAVPGEKVKGMIQGRVLTTHLGEPYRNGAETRVVFKVKCLDPMSHLKKVALEVWTAPSGFGRPASKVRPPMLPGDSPKKAYELGYANGEATGDFPVPEIAAGHDLWVQPVLHAGGGKMTWSEALNFPASTSPLERIPAELTMNLASVPERTIELHSKHAISYDMGSGKKLDMSQKVDTEILEVLTPRSNGEFEDRISIGKLTVNDGVAAKQMASRNLGINLFKKHSFAFIVFPNGRLKEVGIPNFGPPGDIRFDAEDLAMHVSNSIEASSFELPQRTTQPMETWTSKIQMLFGAGKAKTPADVTYKCVYEGTRTTGDTKEAFIRFEGDVRPANKKGRDFLAATVAGTAHFDVGRGYFSKVNVVVRSDIDRGDIYAVTTMETKLTRTAGNPHSIAAAPAATSINPNQPGGNRAIVGKTILQRAGVLKADDPSYKDTGCQHHVVNVNFVAGKSYCIDHMQDKGARFDPFLYLEDPSGKSIAEDDDGGRGIFGELDSRIVIKAAKTGVHKIIVSALSPIETTGPYKLRVIEIAQEAPKTVEEKKTEEKKVEEKKEAPKRADPVKPGEMKKAAIDNDDPQLRLAALSLTTISARLPAELRRAAYGLPLLGRRERFECDSLWQLNLAEVVRLQIS